MLKARIGQLLFCLLFLISTSASIAAQNFEPAKERQCLALNIYFEARSEPLLGKIAVGHVVLNRIHDSRFPESACAVIQQGGYMLRHRCQFSWWCDGLSDRPANLRAWKQSMHLAKLILIGTLPDPSGGALWYHADYVKPSWSKALTRNAKLGRHIFYSDFRTKAKAISPLKAAKCVSLKVLRRTSQLSG